MRKLETLEALRGIAALLVVMYHVQDVFAARAGVVPFGGVFGAGDRGVDLFFVLSGFIITLTHAKDIGDPGRVSAYLYKRVSRVVPSVWIMTIFAILAYACHLGGLAKTFKLEPWNVVASLLLLPQDQPALVNVTWTLKYEMFFYILFAVLIANRGIGLVALLGWQLAVALATVGVLHPSNWLAVFYLRPICLEFGVGMLCALIAGQADLRGHLRDWGWFGLLLGAAVFVGGMVFEGLVQQHMLEPVRLLVYGLGPGVLILTLAMLENDRQLSVPASLVWLGSVSYAVYLTNYSVLVLGAIALRRATAIPPNAAALLGYAVLAVAAGGTFHAWVDWPVQARLKRLGRHLFEVRRYYPASPEATVPGRPRQ